MFTIIAFLIAIFGIYLFRESFRGRLLEFAIFLLAFQRISIPIGELQINIDIVLAIFLIMAILFSKNYKIRKSQLYNSILLLAFLIFLWVANTVNIPFMLKGTTILTIGQSFFHLIRFSILFIACLLIAHYTDYSRISYSLLKLIYIFHIAFYFISFIGGWNQGVDIFTGSVRVYGIFINSTIAGIYFNILFLLLVFFRPKGKFNIWFYLFLITGQLFVVVFTSSKLALLLFLMVLLFDIYILTGKRKITLLVVTVSILGVLMLNISKLKRVNYLIKNIGTEEFIHTADGKRVQMWLIGIEEGKDRLITGHGFLSSRFKGVVTVGENSKETFRSFHSFFIEIFHGSGIFALLVLLTIFFHLFFKFKGYIVIPIFFLLINVIEGYSLQFFVLMPIIYFYFNGDEFEKIRNS